MKMLKTIGTVIMATAGLTAAELHAQNDTWFEPGRMRTSEAEELAWTSFTNVFSASRCRFRKWDGNRLRQSCNDHVYQIDTGAAELVECFSKAGVSP